MENVWYVIVFCLGAIIGSFLNVVIYRFHTGRSLSGRSHCMSCGTTLSWYELFPLFSYLLLRARCRTCSAYIPSRYFVIELLTGCMFLLLFALFGLHLPILAFYMVLFSVLIVITVYDIRHTIIPDELTLVVGVLAGIKILFLPYSILSFSSLSAVISSVVAGLGAGGFFFLLWYVSGGRWLGLGDAKLALPLGMIAGPIGVISMVVLSFWIGAAISLLLLALKRMFKAGTTFLHFPLPRLTIQSEVPFAPFLILGFLLAHLFHANIFVITSYLIPL